MQATSPSVTVQKTPRTIYEDGCAIKLMSNRRRWLVYGFIKGELALAVLEEHGAVHVSAIEEAKRKQEAVMV